MKSFASDQNPIDLEELDKVKCANKCSTLCCKSTKTVHIVKDDGSSEWFGPNTLDALYGLLTDYQQKNYRIVSANTAVGIYKNDGPYDIFISIKAVIEANKI